MTVQIIDGKAIAEEIRGKLRDKITELKLTPGLAVIQVGNNSASKIYVSSKRKACEETGIYIDVHRLPAGTKESEVIALVKKLNKDSKIHGILVQLPLPDKIDERAVLDTINSEKDVDGLTKKNLGALFIGNPRIIPCTPRGIMKLIKSTGVELEGKHAVVIGRSMLVGKPIAMLLQQKNCTVTMCHSRTKNLEEHTKTADILVSAVGVPQLITGEMIKEGAVVIDVGINRLDNGKVVGDVDFKSAKEKAAFITPVPGGVGPMTVVSLLENVVEAAARIANP
ncbi:MAG: bifunctional methylenetetrahydrofolate dehydrogenase/methenyltetrahydrofolate cyclohydrolase FolD [archaeon]